MPFLTDDAWPAGLATIFEASRSKSLDLENEYCGAYDKLLNYCFGPDFTFYVALQTPLTTQYLEDPDPVVFFAVFDSISCKPVFFVQVKWDSDVDNPMSRNRADNQVRDQYDIMLEDCPLPRLWGISAFGTSMRVYRGERESFSLDPQAVPHSGWEDFTPTHLEGEWNTDILSQQGFDKMKEVVNDIVNSTGG